MTAREELFRRVGEIVAALGLVLERFAFDDVAAPEQAAIARCLAAFRLASSCALEVADAVRTDGRPC